MTAQPPRNPYPGLRPFEREDADYFFGRETHTDELLQRLGNARFLAVVGTSGSGKSSLVRAGLIPALHGDRLAVGSHWRVAIFRPGDDPIHAMADALHESLPAFAAAENDFRLEMLETTLRRSSLGLVESVKQSQVKERENVLLVVDQFEELFRFQDRAGTAAAKDESAAFVKLLLEGAAAPSVSIFVLITMRSDFLGDCARFRDFPETVNRGLYLVPRLTREELRQAIVGPAAVAGGKVSHPLVERLLNEIGDDQDQLPVLQHALMRSWRPKGTMGLDEYSITGGMGKALSQHADEAFDEFSSTEQKELICKLFQCITEKGSDQRAVRRPTKLCDIRAICGNLDDSELSRVIEWFRAPGRSFLMPPVPTPIDDDTYIDISHESLIRKWDTLRQWVDEEAESADTYRRLAGCAERYTKGEEGLLQDPGLQLVLDQKEKANWNDSWGRQYRQNYSEAIEFLEKSRKAREAEIFGKENQRKKELKRIRAFAAILAVAFVAAAFIAAYAYVQKQSAESQSRVNRQLLYVADMTIVAKAFDEGTPSRVQEILNAYLPTAVRLQQDDPRSFYWYFLWRVNHQELATLKGHGSSVISVAFSNDGKTLASASDTTVKLWDVATRHELATLKGHGDVVLSVAFSNDGKTLASASTDRTVKLWDVATRHELATLKGHGDRVFSVAFSNDGKTLASASFDTTVKLWEAATEKQVAAQR